MGLVFMSICCISMFVYFWINLFYFNHYQACYYFILNGYQVSLILIRWWSAFDSTVISTFDLMVIRPPEVIIINFESAFFIKLQFYQHFFVSGKSLEQWITMLPAMSLEQWISIFELVCYKRWISYEFKAMNLITMNQFGAMTLYHPLHP